MAEWKYYNPNPRGAHVLDCTVRAICAVTGYTWDEAYALTALEGFHWKNVQDANSVWVTALRRIGYKIRAIENTCPLCYTVDDFADDHPDGKYVLGTGSHAVASIYGEIWDIFDSRDAIPIYYLYKEDDDQ